MVKQAIKRAALALLMCAFAVCLALGISLLVPQAQSAYAEETDPNVHTTHDSSWQRLSSGYSSGRYYLGGDHDRDMVINGDVTLCLNGHILRGTGKGPVITVSSGAKLTLCDCQSNVSRNRYTVDDTGLYIINNGNTGIGTLIAGGIITGGKLTERGGGIYVDSNATFVMEGGTIAGNTASNYGGGVYLNYNSTFNMNGGTIVGNTVNDENSSNVGTRGGGVCAIGARNGVFTMSGNAAISNNTAISKDESKSYGGGVFFDGPIFEMSGNAKISGNVASCGGSIDVVDFFMSDNAQISDNMATDRGGVNCANFTMNGGTISGNTATEAGVNVYGDTFIMNGGEISGNTATDGYSVWVWCDNFTINGGYFGEGEKIYYIPNNGTVNIYGGYFANQDTITDNSWLVNATVQPISSIADDVNYKEGYGYAVYHMHETEGEGDDIIFKPLPYDLSSWDGSLSGGNYYLPYDVTLTNNITIDSDVTLCLNGHILRGNGNGSVVRINSGTFTLCDCSVEQTGTITGASNPSGNDYAWQGSGGAIMNHGTFTMYGGNLSGNTADMGGGIFTRGPVYIYGGTISGNTATTNGGGIYINTGATVTLDGGEISNNNATTRGDGVYVGNGTFTMKSGTLTENAEQGVNVNGDNSSKFYMTGGYFGSNSIIVVGTEANATVQISGGYFETSPSTDFVVSGYTAISDTSVSGYNYQVVAESAAPGRVEYNGTTSYYGTINAAFNYANEVSTSSARAIITLQNNVTTSTTLEIESGKYITLDLNGYILRMTGSGSVITVNNGANFTLCDCKDGDTSIENTIETDYVSHTYNSGVITGGTGTRFDYNSYGGGVYVNGGTFTMSGGTIAGNNASQGGGVYVSSYATFEMSGGAISGSSVNTDGGTGGGVYVDSFGIFIMENGTISGNTAYAGGGVFVHISGTFTMENGTISGNTATRFGGGMNVNYHGTFTMSGGYFGENTLENDDGTVSITGGYFADGDILEDEWLADEDGNSYTAVDISAGDHYGDEDYLQGYPYAVYLSGQTPDYAVEDVNATYGTNYTPKVSNNIHNAGITYSYISGEQTVSELPSVVGQHNVTAAFAATVVTDDDGTKTYYPSDTETFTVTISPVITTTSLEDATYGTEYNQTLGINPAGSATWSITSGSLPDGLNLNESTGVISGTPMDVGGRYIFTVCATVNGISTKQEFYIIVNNASQSAPAANEGYTIDYSAETITILDGYEVYTAQDDGTKIESGSITDYIGQTVYIRFVGTSTHNPSPWTEVTISARPNTPSSVTGSYAVSTTDDTKFVYTITAIEGAEYSKDGTSWQKSNVFDGITPESTVTFYARIAATDSSFVSTAASVEVEFNKLAGSGTVEITGWTEGESANAPSPTSTTNGTANVTYLYVSTDGAGYSSEQAPTNAGSYCVTATFAETAVYAEVTVYCDFTIAECMAIVAFDGNIEYCATVNEAFDYANELETYADGEGADANGRAIITLQSNVTTSATLTVSSGNYITLDLNGYMLRMTGSGSVISVSGDLLLSDAENSSAGSHEVGGVTYDTGVITGGTGTNDGYTYGGGVYVGSNGTFEMSGGTIAGNSATGDGGGVYVKGTFTMENGTIAYNAAGGGFCGGGVYVGGTFTMENGTISGNTAGIGGGVYVYDTFTMNGGTVSDNAAGNGDGVYVSGDFTMNGGEISGNEGHGVFVYNESTFNMKGGYFGNNTIEVFTISGLSDYDGHVYITGGYFASDPASYASADYINSLTHTVVKLADDNHYGDEDYVQGYPYAVYKLVAIGNAVYHTNGTNRDYNRQPLVCDENGDFYITATYADESEVPHGLIAISYKLVGGMGDYTTTAPTNAGTYYIGVNISAVADGTNKVYYAGAQIVDDNYFTFTINKIQVAVPVAASGLEYTGGLLTGVAVAEDMDGIYTVTGGSATNVGNHTATVGLVDTINYEWADPEFDGTVSWSIAKRALTADMFQVTGSYTYTGAEREATYTFADRGGSLAAADFEVSYSNNVNAGNSAVITFTAAANGNYSGSVSLNFTIEKATYDMSGISFGNATYTYDGTEKTLVISGTLPGGMTVTYTTNTLTNAGSLEVTASFTGDTANYNAIADMTATLTINKATYNMSGISFENATYTYDGNEKTLAISGTLPSGVTVTYTNNGHANAGTYTVTASFTGNANYNAIADMTATLKIDPKNITGATVTLGTALTYNGQQQEQTITSVVIDGLAVTYEVSGNVAANAGDYVLTVTGSDNFTGTATADWNIAKRALTANMFQVTGSYVYTGAGCEATYTFSDGDGNFTMSDFGVNYSNNVNAGNSAVITFTATDSGNYSGSVSLNFSIAKADYDMSGISFGNATYTYDGTEKTLVITGELPSGVIVSYTTNTLTNAGSLEVTASFTGDTANYNAIADMTATLTINKATYNMSGISFENATYTYDGNEKTLVISGTLPSGVTVTYTTNTLTNAGSIEVTASFTGDADNYNAIADMTATLTIEKATYDMSGIKFEDVTYTYDGSEKTLVITGNLPDGVTVSYTTNTLTNAGSVEVTASFMGDTDNYNAIADMTATITVDKATYDISGVKFEDATYTYDGEDKTLTISGTLPDGVTVSYTTNTLTNAGSIEVTAMFTGDANNYNTIAPMTATLTIEKATPEYTMPDGLTAVTGQTLDEIELPDGWSWQDGTLSVGEAGENTFTAVYTPVDTDNYNVVTVEINVTVEQATDNTIHYIIWGCIAGIAVVGAVIGWIIVVCVKKRRAKNGE